MMKDNVVYLNIPTVARHEPDIILEAAKSQDFQDVLVIGLQDDGALWLSASTSDAERITFALARSMHKFMRIVDDVTPP